MSATGEAGGDPRPCRSCGQSVYDLLYARTGKSAPIEVRLSANGNVLVDLNAGTYSIVSGEALDLARRGETQLHVNHFMTCPQARAWRDSSRKLLA